MNSALTSTRCINVKLMLKFCLAGLYTNIPTTDNLNISSSLAGGYDS